jgi:solute carrier family 25 oxoglutarate transporter 11
MVSSVFTSCGTLPFDNIKTKVQNQKANAEGVMPYKGIPDCFAKTIAKEGPTGLWAGLPTFYFRIGPHAIITLLVAESLRKKFL